MHSLISFGRTLFRAIREERLRARRKWLNKSRVVRTRPVVDPRSSIEMHRRIIGEPTTPAILRRQAI